MARLVAVGFVAFCLGAGWAHSCVAAGAQSPEVQEAIHEAAARYGVSERWMLAIARCESGFRPWVVSRGGHQGLFQYHWRTWATFSRWAGYEGESPFDPWSASMVTAYALSRGYASHWSCA